MLHWIDLLWLSMACLAGLLAVLHLGLSARLRDPALHFAFAVFAASIALSAALEWQMMRAPTPAAYATLLRWELVVIVPMSLALLYLINLLSPGPRWLFIAIVGTRIAATVANFATGDCLSFREIHGLQQIPLWGGDSVVRAIGTVNPWVVLGQANNVLLAVFTVVALLRLLRQPASIERARKLRILGAALAVMLFAMLWNIPMIWLGVQVPAMLSPPFLGIALVMGYELSSEILRAAELARALQIAESSLRSSQQGLALAERAAGLGTWRWDPLAGEIAISQRGVQMLGFEPGTTPTLADITAGMEPPDLARLRQIVGQAQRESASEFSAEFRMHRPDGGQRWIAIHGQIERDSGSADPRVHGVMFDVSERRSVDEHFQLVVSASPTAMLLVDEGGEIVLANAAAGDVSGYAVDELVGMPVDGLLPEEQRARHGEQRSAYGNEATQRMMNGQREVGLRRKDGTRVPIQVALKPVQSAGRQFVIAAIDDLRERRARELEISQQRDALAHYARVGMLSELSGSLAHELNQPLAAILSNAQASLRFLNRTSPDLDEVREGLTQIVASDKHAGEVIRRLRAMLRKERVDFVRLQLNDVVRDVLGIMHADLLTHRIVVREQLAPDLPMILGDRVQLQQVVLNLITNASEAMRELADARQLTLRTQSVEGGVGLQVSDVGPGIPEAELARIFQPYVSTKPDGIGFGLALCASLVTAHGGKLWASNNTGGGATLHLFLPAAG